MNEKNRHRLRDAIGRLPQHEPPADVWYAIDARTQRERLGRELPTYAPPPAVWNAVSEGLEHSPRSGVLRSLSPRVRWAASAAAVVLLFFAGWQFGNSGGEAATSISYAYSQETSPEPVNNDWDEDEDSFSEARRRVLERNEPTLNHLGHELDELTSAREEVKAMLVAYGDDATVVQQLAEIERERDDVYRRIIVEL